MQKEIKMDNAAFSAAFVLSFSKSSDFVKATEDDFFQHKPLKERRLMLRDVFKAGQAMKAAEKK